MGVSVAGPTVEVGAVAVAVATVLRVEVEAGVGGAVFSFVGVVGFTAWHAARNKNDIRSNKGKRLRSIIFSPFSKW